MRGTVPRGKTGVSVRVARYRETDRSIVQSRWISWRTRHNAVFSSTGTRPSPPVLALPISLPPSCRSTFYRHSPRSILSADNASTSLRFRGGGVALLATDRSSKDRYFRQGVNRYRESRLRSSSSNLMQHLTFPQHIPLSRLSRLRSRLLFSFLLFLSCLVHHVSLVPSSIPFSCSGVLELPIRPVFNYRVSVFVILARSNKLVRDDTWLDLPSR